MCHGLIKLLHIIERCFDESIIYGSKIHELNALDKQLMISEPSKLRNRVL